jgi:hypothetical protein
VAGKRALAGLLRGAIRPLALISGPATPSSSSIVFEFYFFRTLIAATLSIVLICEAQYFSIIATFVRQLLAI